MSSSEDLADDVALAPDELLDAVLGQAEQRVERAAIEGLRLGGALNLNEQAATSLDDVHVYFGAHVIKRGVIFVDLSLAQVAAFGSTLAFLFGVEMDSLTAYFLSLGFALLGAPRLKSCLAIGRVGLFPRTQCLRLQHGHRTSAAQR